MVDEQLKSPDMYDLYAPASRCVSPFSDEDDGVESGSDHGTSSGAQSSMFMNFTSDLNPQSPTKKQKSKQSTTYKVNGVNILNRKSLDSKTVMERLKRRRENHNHVERKRRDNINHTILEISRLIPQEPTSSTKLNKGNILRMAVDYIKELQSENLSLKSQSRKYTEGVHAYPHQKTSIGVDQFHYPASADLNKPHTISMAVGYTAVEMPKFEPKSHHSYAPAHYPSSLRPTTTSDRQGYVSHSYATALIPQQYIQPLVSASLPNSSLPLPSFTQLSGASVAPLPHPALAEFALPTARNMGIVEAKQKLAGDWYESWISRLAGNNGPRWNSHGDVHGKTSAAMVAAQSTKGAQKIGDFITALRIMQSVGIWIGYQSKKVKSV
ncbi:HLH-domain-containing protein [Basidiobolus meristosporus CBS 931.73]|uniref:HLH-domain-containing protein n=1 Tax=Basidiobolus meristosporus CBS 931.73 TaxID=1314790 RepID=A0A1Y1YBX6_9FUNG|nr:HLH-domain-containing protein [Basidiobolus meristosporus CBS 931.73]|eukprot:ORX95462.1 HLH-domain-containing protein [Basidiobolus meristosporus CBS 931.73]